MKKAYVVLYKGRLPNSQPVIDSVWTSQSKAWDRREELHEQGFMTTAEEMVTNEVIGRLPIYSYRK